MAPARIYEESRKVCFLCMKKANRELTDTFKQNTLEVLQVSIDFSDTRVPFEICFGCLTALWKASKGEKLNLPCLFNFKGVKPTKISWETNFCECLICETARVNDRSKIPVPRSESKKKRMSKTNMFKKGVQTVSPSLDVKFLTLATRHLFIKL